MTSPGQASVVPTNSDRPSLVVLPFQSIPSDPDMEWFADGIVEEITTALSRFRSLFVIARNSAFTFKGESVDVRDVGRRLGVRYVLEGSVRHAGGQARVTGQLIEAETGTLFGPTGSMAAWLTYSSCRIGSRPPSRERSSHAFVAPRSSERRASRRRISPPMTSTCAPCQGSTPGPKRDTNPRSASWERRSPEIRRLLGSQHASLAFGSWVSSPDGSGTLRRREIAPSTSPGRRSRRIQPIRWSWLAADTS